MEITEKKLKEILKEQHEETQRYLGVLAESFESQVKLVAESILGIQEELTALKNIVAQATEAIANLQIQVTALRDMVVKNTEDIEIIKVDIEAMKMDFSIIKNDLKEKVNREEFAALEKRMFLVEKKLQRV